MFVCPTWKRPDKLRRLLEAMRETQTIAPGMIIVQGNDQMEAYKPVIEIRPKNWEWICLERDVGWVQALNLMLKIRPQEKWYGVINDDHVPVTPEWDTKMLSLMGPWALVTCMDNSKEVQWRASGPLMAGGELLRTCGFFMPPCTWHICGDDWWQTVGRAFSIWKVACNVRVDQPDSAIFAVNNTKDFAPDETHQSSYGNWFEQVAQYHRWLAEAGGDTMEKLRLTMQANNVLPKQANGRFVIA